MKLLRKPEGIGFPMEINSDELHRIRISNINLLLIKNPNENTWRSWELFSDRDCQNSVGFSPLLLDIDNNDHKLNKAHSLTLKCLDLIEKKSRFLKSGGLRVVFSGKKGFHIEAIPYKPVSNRYFRNYILCELNNTYKKPQYTKNMFEDGTIDPGHDFIRVTGSYNSWREDGALIKRKVIQFTPEEFRKLKIGEIIAKSQGPD